MSTVMEQLERAIQHREIKWRHLRLRVTFTPDWMSRPGSIHHMAHIEVETCQYRQPMPISETGYRSQFVRGDAFADIDDVVREVQMWMDRAALSREWKAVEAEQRQGRLF